MFANLTSNAFEMLRINVNFNENINQTTSEEIVYHFLKALYRSHHNNIKISFCGP